MAKKIHSETRPAQKTPAAQTRLSPKAMPEETECQKNASSSLWWPVFTLLCGLNFATRFYSFSQPPWVCWDETHFGKMGSWYINRTFFFDVHPPLGKMLIGFVGYTSGYNGTFAFEKPGDHYHDHNYLGMRASCTLLGCALMPFSFLTVWEMTSSLLASSLAAAFVIFDIGMLTLNRYILLDPILLFFISGATYATTKFRHFQWRHPHLDFGPTWWSLLTLVGIMLAGAISVKFVGLFVVLLVGMDTVWQLWDVMGDLSRPFSHTVKHFAARAFCLIVLPVIIYVSIFWVHLTVLYKSGTGDGHFSSSFQTSLEGNVLHNATMPRHLAYGAIVTLKSQRTGGGYLHSHYHLYPEGVGAKQQQVTSYAHKDENNKFLVKRWNSDPPTMFSPEWNSLNETDTELVRHGDLVRLEHVVTGRNIHTHQEPAPVSKKMYQVTGYGEKGQGDANDVWRVEILGGSDGDLVQTVTSKIKFHHYFLKCVLTVPGKQLPKWGYEQQEVSCNPTTRDTNAIWNIEDNLYPKLENVSFHNFAPGFVSRFLESHAVMLTGNAGLKPKEGEYTSRPWEWPINLRGQFFSGNDHRVYLLGNPIIWWGNLVLLVFFLFVYAIDAVRAQRTGERNEEREDNIDERVGYLTSGMWLLTGWGLHYVPFWAMGRVLYFHHYFPALLFSNMLSAIAIDYCVIAMSSILPENLAKVFKHTLIGGVLAALCYSFLLFSPLAYGMDETPGHMSNSSVHHLKWMSSWEF